MTESQPKSDQNGVPDTEAYKVEIEAFVNAFINSPEELELRSSADFSFLSNINNYTIPGIISEINFSYPDLLSDEMIDLNSELLPALDENVLTARVATIYRILHILQPMSALRREILSDSEWSDTEEAHHLISKVLNYTITSICNLITFDGSRDIVTYKGKKMLFDQYLQENCIATVNPEYKVSVIEMSEILALLQDYFMGNPPDSFSDRYLVEDDDEE